MTNSQSNRFYKLIIFAVIYLFLSFGLFGQTFLQDRNSKKLKSWKFYKGEYPSAKRLYKRPEADWKEITVPHTWNKKDVLTKGPECYKGVGWYRKNFTLPEKSRDKRYFIRFEGVSLTADVYVNGEFVGKHDGGYSAFCFEITPYLNFNQDNLIAVKADNSIKRDVAPAGTYLYPLFGGIYRPVTIFSTSRACISPLDYASSGTYIHQKDVSSDKAEIQIENKLDYKAKNNYKTSFDNTITNPKGEGENGFYAEYYDNHNFRGQPTITQVDTNISFNYGNKAPFQKLSVDSFSVKWTTNFTAPKSGYYSFQVTSDDGTRLYLEDSLLINNWGKHAPTSKSAAIYLEKGETNKLKIEYNEVGGGAMVELGWKYKNADKNKSVIVTNKIRNKKGNIVKTKSSETKLTSNKVKILTQNFTIDNPNLWDAKRNPYLYRVETTIKNKKGEILDKTVQPLGLRSFHVDPNKGLFINGEKYDLYGVTRHQEWEGLGSALKNKHHRQDFRYMKEVGANGLRLAHYQQDNLMYSLADTAGLVVWAEIPLTPPYIEKDNQLFIKNTEQQLIELIKQNYNHPSILFWGLFNEVPITPKHLRRLHNKAKSLDSQRLTTQAAAANLGKKNFITDLAAWNKYYGWYYGHYDSTATWLNRINTNNPDLKVGISEYGAGGCIDQHQLEGDKPAASDRFFPIEYQNQYHEETWKRIKDLNSLWCKFVWNTFDFSWTNVKRGNRNWINHKGMITHDRKHKKDIFYFYKANWTDKPVLHITSKRFKKRDKKITPVKVYTTMEEVSLLLNGEKISTKKLNSDIHIIKWEEIKLQKGLNKINVIGKKNGETYTDSCEWIYNSQTK